jgi:hypothetical protein
MMRHLGRIMMWTTLPLILAQFGCAARGVQVGPTTPTPSVSEADRTFCDESARAEADGIAGADPTEGARRAMGIALHPAVVVNTMGLSLFATPFVVLAGATVKEVQDSKLRRQAYTYALGPCLALVEQEQHVRAEDPDGIEHGRIIARRYIQLAETSAAASARNAKRAVENPATPASAPSRFADPPIRPGDRPVAPVMDYAVWAERDRQAALALYRRALGLQERLLGPDHPDVADTLDGYAAVLRTAHRDDEAAAIEVRVKAFRGGQAEP